MPSSTNLSPAASAFHCAASAVSTCCCTVPHLAIAARSAPLLSVTRSFIGHHGPQPSLTVTIQPFEVRPSVFEPCAITSSQPAGEGRAKGDPSNSPPNTTQVAAQQRTRVFRSTGYGETVFLQCPRTSTRPP